jgi:tetratricopeptide (TPR) repeat protein
MSDDAAAADDLSTQVLVRSARGRVLAERGELDDGLRLCREAVSLAEETDDVNMRADALTGLAEVLRLGWRREDAARVLDEALLLYQAKGNVVSGDHVTRALKELHGEAR